MKEDDSTVLRNRLIGAAALCLLIFLLSLFVPEPAPDSDNGGSMVIDLKERETAAVTQREADQAASGDTPDVAHSAPAPESPAAAAEGRERASMPPADEQRPAPQRQAPQPAAPPESAHAEAAPAPAASQRAPREAQVKAAQPAPEQPAAQGDWWIQAASYSDRDTALRGKARASRLGYGAELREVRVEGKQWWRLQIGPFSSEASAQSKINTVEAAGFRGARALERH